MMCRLVLYGELFYAIIPTLLTCFLLFSYPYTSRYIFNRFFFGFVCLFVFLVIGIV